MTAWLFLLVAVLPRTVRLLFHGRLLTRALPPPLHGRALRKPVENVRGLVRRPPCKRIAHPQRWLVRPQTGLPPQPRRDSRSDHDRSAPRLTAARCGSGAALPPDTPPHRPQWPRRPPCCLTRGPSLGGRGPQAVRPGGASPRKKAPTAPPMPQSGSACAFPQPQTLS